MLRLKALSKARRSAQRKLRKQRKRARVLDIPETILDLVPLNKAEEDTWITGPRDRAKIAKMLEEFTRGMRILQNGFLVPIQSYRTSYQTGISLTRS